MVRPPGNFMKLYPQTARSERVDRKTDLPASQRDIIELKDGRIRVELTLLLSEGPLDGR